MNNLIIVRGLPGSGKSTLAEMLLELPDLSEAKLLDPDLVQTNSPQFVQFCLTRPKNLPLNKLVYRFLLYSACEKLSSGGQVIWSQPWRDLELLRLTLENINVIGYGLPETAEYPFTVVVVEIRLSENEARRRVILRYQMGHHRLTVEGLKSFEQSFDSLDGLKLPKLILDGTLPLSQQIAQVTNFLREVIGEK